MMPKSAERSERYNLCQSRKPDHSPASSIDQLLDVVNKPQQISHGASIMIGRNSGRMAG